MHVMNSTSRPLTASNLDQPIPAPVHRPFTRKIAPCKKVFFPNRPNPGQDKYLVRGSIAPLAKKHLLPNDPNKSLKTTPGVRPATHAPKCDSVNFFGGLQCRRRSLSNQE
jgi:hypothetical protein